MREPGWAFVGGGNIASPEVIPEYYVTDEDKSVSQRTKSKKAEGESRSPASSRTPGLLSYSLGPCVSEKTLALGSSMNRGNPPPHSRRKQGRVSALAGRRNALCVIITT
jgi:hypothetical protein